MLKGAHRDDEKYQVSDETIDPASPFKSVASRRSSSDIVGARQPCDVRAIILRSQTIAGDPDAVSISERLLSGKIGDLALGGDRLCAEIAAVRFYAG